VAKVSRPCHWLAGQGRKMMVYQYSAPIRRSILAIRKPNQAPIRRGQTRTDPIWCLLPGEEVGIAHAVFPGTIRIILVSIELFPYAGRIDVLISLIPPPINNLGQPRVVVVSFELRILWNFDRRCHRRCLSICSCREVCNGL
jgi:hypothetical protein